MREGFMKKVSMLLLAAGLFLASAEWAQAIDFKAKGEWVMSFGYGQNGNFQGKYKGHSPTGFMPGQDDFEAVQRVRLQLDAVASEALSGTVHFEIGETTWGQNDTGGALGADRNIMELKSAFLDWMVPDSTIKVRMGIQNITTPAMAAGNSVLNDEVAAVVVTGQVNDNVSLTGFWARPYNDNYVGYTKNGQSGYRASYLDNIDSFGLFVPLTGNGFRLTPWGMYTAIGPNAFRGEVNEKGYPFGNIDNMGAGSSYYMAGMFPVAGARHKDFSDANTARKLSAYGNAWWTGLTGQLSAFDPFNISFELEYGSVTWDDDGRLNRQGWFGALIMEYKLDWGVPGIYGWYGSGDDSNPANGSERLPALDPNNANNFSYFAFDGAPYIERCAVIGNNMAGTWGIGARLNNFSFVEDLSHIVRINYIRGTNSPTMAKKMSLSGLWANGNSLEPNNIGNGLGLGMPGMYMTSKDSALEVGTTNNYQLYENFSINLEAAYIAIWLDTSNSVWGARHRNNQSIPQTKDAWNVNVSFAYSF